VTALENWDSSSPDMLSLINNMKKWEATSISYANKMMASREKMKGTKYQSPTMKSRSRDASSLLMKVWLPWGKTMTNSEENYNNLENSLANWVNIKVELLCSLRKYSEFKASSVIKTNKSITWEDSSNRKRQTAVSMSCRCPKGFNLSSKT